MLTYPTTWTPTRGDEPRHRVYNSFNNMLQVFHLDVAKIDLDVVYIAMVIYACFKRIVSSVSSVFSRILHVFQLDVSKVDLGEHMLQWSWWLEDSGLPQPPVVVVGAPSWVIVWGPRTGRRLRRRGR